MRTRTGSAFCLLPLVFALAACNQQRPAAMAQDSTMAGPAKVDKQAEEKTVRDISARWMQMFATKDSSGIGALFADDGYEMPPNAKAMKGPDEVTRGRAR